MHTWTNAGTVCRTTPLAVGRTTFYRGCFTVTSLSHFILWKQVKETL